VIAGPAGSQHLSDWRQLRQVLLDVRSANTTSNLSYHSSKQTMPQATLLSAVLSFFSIVACGVPQNTADSCLTDLKCRAATRRKSHRSQARSCACSLLPVAVADRDRDFVGTTADHNDLLLSRLNADQGSRNAVRFEEPGKWIRCPHYQGIVRRTF